MYKLINIKAFQILIILFYILPFNACSQDVQKIGFKKGKSITIGNISYTTIEGYIEVPENYEKQASKK